MAPPTFIQEAETAWNSTANKTTASFNVLTSDVLVAYGIGAEWASVFNTITVTGGSLTWTERQSVRVAQYCSLTLATAVVDADKAMTVTFTHTPASQYMGGNVFTFRGSDGVGASSKANTSGASTLSLTTTQADSVIVVVNGDWNAVDGGSRAWRTGAGTLTEQTYFRDSAHYTVYGGYHANAGAIGAKSVGLTDPTGQKYSIAAVEILGTASAPPAGPRINSLMLTGAGR